MKIGFLSVFQDLFLGYLILECATQGVVPDTIIFDGAGVSEKDRRIYEERTAGRILPLTPFDWEDFRIPHYFVKNHNSDVCVGLVKQLELDLLVNAGTPRILKTPLLQAPRVGAVNCHPGLLPQFRGCTCVEWAVYLDEQVGNTVHFITERIDEGPIILQESLTFSPQDTYVDVRVKTYKHAINLLARGLKEIIKNNLNPAAMPPQAEGRYFDVIDDDKMHLIVEKLRKGAYKYQLRVA